MLKEKWNYNTIKEYLNKYDFELLVESYNINSKTNITLKTKEGYLVDTTFHKFKISHNPEVFNKTNSHTCENIITWCKLNNKPFTLLSGAFLGAHQKLKWKCLKSNCNEEFEATWGNIQSHKGCPYCSGKKVALSNCLITKCPELVKEWHPTKNGNITPYNVTFGSGKSVWWKCSNGHEWKVSINNRRYGNGCPYCAGHFASSNNNLFSINPSLCDEWDYSKNKKHPSEFTPNSLTKVWWICNECGNNWKTRISHRNHGSGCPECKVSRGEKRIAKFLKENNINYEPQKEFGGLIGVNGMPLSYDFYLPMHNILIEFQGEQHKVYKKGLHKSIEDFYRQIEHDERKRNYSKNNNFKLIEIWYYDFDNVETILSEHLKL